MKVTIEVECTPDEARQFLGLPDVKPMQQALMTKLETQVSEAAAAFSPEALVRSWMQGMQGGPDALRDLFARFLRPQGGAPPRTDA